MASHLNRALSRPSGPPLPRFRTRVHAGSRAWSLRLREVDGGRASRTRFSLDDQALVSRTWQNLSNCSHTLHSPPSRNALPNTSNRPRQTLHLPLSACRRPSVLVLRTLGVVSCATASADVRAHTSRACVRRTPSLGRRAPSAPYRQPAQRPTWSGRSALGRLRNVPFAPCAGVICPCGPVYCTWLVLRGAQLDF